MSFIQLPDPELAILRGRVTNAETGEFARLDQIRLSWQRGVNGPGEPFAATSFAIDGEGRFALQTLPGTYTDARLTFSRSYEPQTVSLTVEAGTETTLDVAATPVGQGSVTGQVTDAVTGAPVSDARVEISGNFRGFADTDAQGRYTLSAPEGAYNVTRLQRGLQQRRAVPPRGVRRRPVRLPGHTDQHRCRRADERHRHRPRRARRRLRGHVHRPRRRHRRPAGLGCERAHRPDLHARDLRRTATPVAADGTFSVTTTDEFLASYLAIVGVRAPGYDTQYVDNQPTAWAADAFSIGSEAVTFDVGTITLRRSGEDLPGLSVSGTVRDDETNAPLAGAAVTVARLDAPGFHVAVTDDAGAYRVDGLDAGQYIALFTQDEYTPEFYPDADAWTEAEALDLQEDRSGLDALMGGLNRPVEVPATAPERSTRSTAPSATPMTRRCAACSSSPATARARRRRST